MLDATHVPSELCNSTALRFFAYSRLLEQHSCYTKCRHLNDESNLGIICWMGSDLGTRLFLDEVSVLGNKHAGCI